jgi:hypothetical protein
MTLLIFDNIPNSAGEGQRIEIDEAIEDLTLTAFQSMIIGLMERMVKFNLENRFDKAGEVIINSIYKKPYNLIKSICILVDSYSTCTAGAAESFAQESQKKLFFPNGMGLFLMRPLLPDSFEDKYLTLSKEFQLAIERSYKYLKNCDDLDDSDPLFSGIKASLASLGASTYNQVIESGTIVTKKIPITDEISITNLTISIIDRFAKKLLPNLCHEQKDKIQNSLDREISATREMELRREMEALRIITEQERAKLTADFEDSKRKWLEEHKRTSTIELGETTISLTIQPSDDAAASGGFAAEPHESTSAKAASNLKSGSEKRLGISK